MFGGENANPSNSKEETKGLKIPLIVPGIAGSNFKV